MTEQIKERREKREERKWPPARFSAFLRCPQGVTGDLTRPWAVGPTNLRFLKVERREKREERREKREEITKKAARDPQMRPREVPNEVPRGLWAGGMAEKREEIEEK